MKILNVLPAYEPAWAFGGVVRCMSNLCRAMAEAGADVSVYTTNVDGRGGLLETPLGKPVNLGGVKTTYFPSTFGRKSVWDSRALLRTLNRTFEDFDIVYVSAIWQQIGITTGRIAKKRGVPYVVGAHGSFDSELLKVSRLRKLLWWRLFLNSNLRYCSGLHLTSEYERRQAVILGTEFPHFIVPNCIRPDAFEMPESLGSSVRKTFRILPDAPLLMSIGRTDPKKRLDIILDAFEVIHRACPDSHLMFVGEYENDYGLEIKRKSDAMEASEFIIWAGYRSGDDLKGCYVAGDIFILPSMDENFGMVVTEAMAAGMPVVVSDHVGVAEDVARTGSGIVTKVHADDMARAVLELLSDSERMRGMGEQARKTAKKLYSGPKVAQQMIEAFEGVVSGRRSEKCAWSE